MSFYQSGHKFGARKTFCNEQHAHPSALEAAVCNLLHLWEKSGEFKVVSLQPLVRFPEAACRYKPDFLIRDVKNNYDIWVEAKGAEDATYARNKRLWKIYGPGPLWVFKGNYRNPVHVETIIPKLRLVSCPRCGEKFSLKGEGK